VEGFDIKSKSLTAEGNLAWPWIDITSAKADFDDGSAAEVNGKVELEKRVIDDGHLQFYGPFARKWLQPDFSYRDLSLALNFDGPLKQITHRGHLEAADVTGPQLQPTKLRCDWSGTLTNLERAELTATAGSSSLRIKGGLGFGASGADCLLTTLSLASNGIAQLELQQPTRILITREAEPRRWRT